MGILKRQHLDEQGVFDQHEESLCEKCMYLGDEELLTELLGERICQDCFWKLAIVL